MSARGNDISMGNIFGAMGITVMFSAQSALAGMPQPLFWNRVLTDASEGRLKTISFFLVALLVVTVAFQLAWNSIRKDFPRLPRLTYGRAMGIVMIWGALFILILTMISGAREVMTPGAWEKNGATYRLKAPEGKPPVSAAPVSEAPKSEAPIGAALQR